MFLRAVTLLGSFNTALRMPQILLSQTVTDSEIAASLSGLQGFLVIIAGLVLTFAFQLLLANFFIAIGISYSDADNPPDTAGDRSESLDDKITHVGTIVGLRALGTFSTALFLACFLAVKLSFINDAILGAILGLVIWAAYFSLLVWISVTTVESVIGSVLDKLTGGLQGILGTAAIAFGAKSVSEQVVSTAETAATKLRRELSTSVDLVNSHAAIENYLKQLRLPEADRQEIQAEFEKLVTEPEMTAISRDNHLDNIRRQTFVDLVSSRTDFSKEDVHQALDSVEAIWQRVWGKQQQQDTTDNLIDYLKPVEAEEVNNHQLSTQLEQLIEETRQLQAQHQAATAQKIAETTAWWLFGTAFTSAIASALAGAMSIKS